MKKYRAFALFSGGLDSVLAVLWMKKIGVEVIPVFFRTYFFGPTRAYKAAKQANLELTVFDISEEHLKMLKNPEYGYGKYLNPCIDCHGLMFKEAAKRMKEWDIDFIISGEVLAQRPMSQRKDALNSVAKLSSVKDLIIRPLSQKLLRDTLPIREGWILKDELLDIQGRTRKRQMELVKEFGLTEYSSPGGGCLLTEKKYCDRLADLMKYNLLEGHYIEFLKYGRHFRISDNVKLVMGRKKSENEHITEIADDRDLVLMTENTPGPLGVLCYKEQPALEDIETAAKIILRYNSRISGEFNVRYGKKFKLNDVIRVYEYSDDESKKYNIN